MTRNVPFQITGEWDFSVPKDVLDRLERCSKHTTLTVQATVIEAITGIKQEATAVDVRFYDSRYKLEFHPSMSVNFMPGFNYDVKV